MLTDGRELFMDIGIGFRLEAERLEMRINKVKTRGRLTSCCCCQVIELALERGADSLFRKLCLGGKGGGGEIVLGGIKG